MRPAEPQLRIKVETEQAGQRHEKEDKDMLGLHEKFNWLLYSKQQPH